MEEVLRERFWLRVSGFSVHRNLARVPEKQRQYKDISGLLSKAVTISHLGQAGEETQSRFLVRQVGIVQ